MLILHLRVRVEKAPAMRTLDQATHGFPPGETIAAARLGEEHEPESKQMGKKR